MQQQEDQQCATLPAVHAPGDLAMLLELAGHDGASLLIMPNNIVENFGVAAVVNLENGRSFLQKAPLRLQLRLRAGGDGEIGDEEMDHAASQEFGDEEENRSVYGATQAYGFEEDDEEGQPRKLLWVRNGAAGAYACTCTCTCTYACTCTCTCTCSCTCI